MSELPGRNIKFKIEYDGTNFCGWQVQKSHREKKSIQETIESALRKILNEKIRLIASGRTDSGVHAKTQTANFYCKSKIDINKLQQAVNALLPYDIAVMKAEEVPVDFHSRFNAKSKVYRYIILNQRYASPFLRNHVYFFRYPLDLKIMYREAKTIIGRHDFKAFCASGSKVKDTVRTIKNITIRCRRCNGIVGVPGGDRETDCKFIVIDIEADGFLYNMVRNIVGTLIEIGRGKFPKGSLREILLSKDRNAAGPTAPARGLCLIKVNY